MMRETHFAGFLSKYLETKITQVLRFKHKQWVFLYFLVVTNRQELGMCVVISVYTFPDDPDISLKLVDLVLDEISRLQEEGPSDQDVLTIFETEQRAHENGLQDSSKLPIASLFCRS
ncbi:hypothetical protein MKX01_011498 [Papaver californicum]|nr:hypothetical protein MKX01_011498 [Papaver californicum]